jgi:hypothetical protein
MLVFSKKQFLKLIRAPLRVENTDKKSRFTGLTLQSIREFLEDEKEWVKLTELNRGRYSIGVVQYLTGIFFFHISLNLSCKGLFIIIQSMSFKTSQRGVS